MGYYTTFELNTKPLKGIIIKSCITELQEEIGNESSDADLQSIGSENIIVSFNSKWYNHEEFLINLSKKYDKILITLYGDGEGQGDMWVKYFYQGKIQKGNAEIVYPPCILV